MRLLVGAMLVLALLLAGAWLVLWQADETPVRNAPQPAAPAPTSAPSLGEPASLDRRAAPPPIAAPGSLRLRTATGEPNRVRVEVRCGSLLTVIGPRSELVLDPAPELPVQVRQEGACDWSEPVTMPDDRAEHTAEVIVPTRR